jgi:uncharacterized protein YsxB (DUF464 family)
MIKIAINKDKILITGHANFEEYGKDIVCASVSSIVTTTVNAITSLEDTISFKEDVGYVEIIINRHTDITDKLINNMVNLLTELQTQYSNNIKIK